MKTPTDYFGNVIAKGDIIAYPGRGGSSLWMNHGKVIEIVCKKKYHWESEPCEMVVKLRIRQLSVETSRTGLIECLDRVINLSHVAKFGVL